MPVLVKYQKIARELQKRIASGQYVERLPSTRALIKEFKVSSRTMHKVFAELKFFGIIEPTARGAWIKVQTEGSLHRKDRILLISPLVYQNLESNPLLKMLVSEITPSGFELIYCDHPQESVCATVERYDLGSSDGVIFANSTFSTEAANFLQRRRIPFVTTNRPEAEHTVNWVDWDHYELFFDFVSNMVMRGIRSLDVFWRQQSTLVQDNHASIIGDFRAVKRSFSLFNPELDMLSEEDWGDVDKYVDHLCRLKHLPDVVWVVDNSRDMLVEKLHERGIENTDFLITHERSRTAENSVAFYTMQAYAKLAHKAWSLLCYVRRHPQAAPRCRKQRCEVKFYEKSFQHLTDKKNTIN